MNALFLIGLIGVPLIFLPIKIVIGNISKQTKRYQQKTAGLAQPGHLAQADLATLVGAAAVAVVTPDWDEPYGLVAAEALSCGTPVAAYARGEIGEEEGRADERNDLLGGDTALGAYAGVSVRDNGDVAVNYDKCAVDAALQAYALAAPNGQTPALRRTVAWLEVVR